MKTKCLKHVDCVVEYDEVFDCPLCVAKEIIQGLDESLEKIRNIADDAVCPGEPLDVGRGAE